MKSSITNICKDPVLPLQKVLRVKTFVIVSNVSCILIQFVFSVDLFMATTLTPEELCAIYINHVITSINRQHSEGMVFPGSLIQIVSSYAQDYFAWDNVNCRENVVISEDKLTANATESGNRIIVASNDLNYETVSRAEWELVINNKIQSIVFAMGFITHPIDNKIFEKGDSSFLCARRQCSVNMQYTNRWFRKYDLSTTVNDFNNARIDAIADGDRFKLVFDFGKRTVDFHWNDAFIGTVTKRLPDRVVPAIAVCRAHVLKCTKWDLQYVRKSSKIPKTTNI